MNSVDINKTIIENARLIQDLGATEGKLVSPINLDIIQMTPIQLNVLKCYNIDVLPKKVKVTNTGYTAIISAMWQQDRPYLTGGPLAGNYTFSQIHFHWGENEMYGSEHTIDGASMPMEVHAVYIKDEYKSLEAALRRKDGVVILVYFCKLQGEPNPFMDRIVNRFPSIQTANTSVRVVPLCLSNITRPFNQDYFLYWGSVETLSFVHSILWLISREPLGVSMEQIAQFRTLHDTKKQPIMSNIRPMKDMQKRHVFHISPSGSLYASLLPIPRDPVPAQPQDTTTKNEV